MAAYHHRRYHHQSLVSALVTAVLLMAPAAAAEAGDATAAAHIIAEPHQTAAATPAAPLIRPRQGSNVRVLLLTDCAKYQDWQAIAAAFAWRELGQPGAFTRVANCAEKDRAAYPKAMLKYMDTHMAPHVAWNAELKDYYAAYNKPIAVKSWLANNPKPKEEYLLLMDADMLLRRPFSPEEFNVSRGWAVAGHYSYMQGVANNLALRHIPEVTPYNDSIAGPPGRRGDVVGAPYFMHMDDARTLAPLWYDYTVRVRNDTQAYKDSGDAAAKNGGRIWIAEMYGYAFGAAKAGLGHRWGEDFMLYPGYTPLWPPRNIHYGLQFKVDNWSFKKHYYLQFNVHKCPPWNLTVEHPQEGIFPPPPHPDTLKDAKEYLKEFRDIISVHTMAQINAAICDYHRKNCPPSQQLTDICNKAEELYAVAKARYKMLEEVFDCVDHHTVCQDWAKRGECHAPGPKGGSYTRQHCRAACGLCKPLHHYAPLPERQRAAAAAEAARAAAAGDAVKAAEATKAAIDQVAAGHAATAPGGSVGSTSEVTSSSNSSSSHGGSSASAHTVGDLLAKQPKERHTEHARTVTLPTPHEAGLHAVVGAKQGHAADRAPAAEHAHAAGHVGKLSVLRGVYGQHQEQRQQLKRLASFSAGEAAASPGWALSLGKGAATAASAGAGAALNLDGRELLRREMLFLVAALAVACLAGATSHTLCKARWLLARAEKDKHLSE